VQEPVASPGRRVVDKDVDPSRDAKGTFSVSGHGNITLHGITPAPLFSYQGRGMRIARFVRIQGNYMRSFRGEAEGNFAPDPVSRACDQCRPSCESLRHAFPPLFVSDSWQTPAYDF
jgi:hypothetical protein